MAEVRDRADRAPRTVYDLTVSGLHTFYAVAGSTPVLVHNCNDIVLDGAKFPGLAHTITEHVTPDRLAAEALAAQKTAKYGRDTPNSVWVNQDTAQKVVDAALKDKASMITNWLRGNKTELDWSGFFGPRDSSLGTVYYANGTAAGRAPTAAGNGYYIKLVRAPKGPGIPKHPRGYYVQTCYPK
ncbi:RNase A-like domain-containing protein [Streptomyces sp. DSM 15324]|uniref:RNase A-like domain-containing protein n=1 Tax=Streptomyces sp. DSM 15324 TaxID=1739111 RepID=UPI000748871C|nr:RNase A-like domain-containing protein [Streptomyces sp. DSM 15324]KUO06752.1 hypothetical protein AQJ58_38885 [Streptomyces sp. DSM 15324]